ncbi:MAG: hypothetical protein JO189_01980 [Deltaproteobacteria bacterium]|nr:hypothetical protein [Deltaproteobacteria bacterium]
MNTAPRLQQLAPAPKNLSGDVVGLTRNSESSAETELFHLANTLTSKPPLSQEADAMAASSESSSVLKAISTQLTTAALNQDADFKAAVNQVSLVAPTPEQYLAYTASDVAHSVFDLLDQSNPSVSDVFNRGQVDHATKICKCASFSEQSCRYYATSQSFGGFPPKFCCIAEFRTL